LRIERWLLTEDSKSAGKVALLTADRIPRSLKTMDKWH
jgi:hypothetical protein